MYYTVIAFSCCDKDKFMYSITFSCCNIYIAIITSGQTRLENEIFMQIDIKSSQKIRQDISIGAKIREYRLSNGLTQEDVVAYLQLQGIDLSQSTYSQIECGTYNIRVSELKALTILFHTDYNALFSGI